MLKAASEASTNKATQISAKMIFSPRLITQSFPLHWVSLKKSRSPFDRACAEQQAVSFDKAQDERKRKRN
jgi:hypothetical protein